MQTNPKLEELDTKNKRHLNIRSACLELSRQLASQIYLVSDLSKLEDIEQALHSALSMAKEATDTECGIDLIPSSPKKIRQMKSLEPLLIRRKRKPQVQ